MSSLHDLSGEILKSFSSQLKIYLEKIKTKILKEGVVPEPPDVQLAKLWLELDRRMAALEDAVQTLLWLRSQPKITVIDLQAIEDEIQTRRAIQRKRNPLLKLRR